MAFGVKRAAPEPTSDDVVHLNVGGINYDTRRSTLCLHNGPLRNMFRQDGHFSGKVDFDRDDRMFIDRDGRVFACVLGFLRTGVATVPSGLTLAQCQFERGYFFEDPPLVRNEAVFALDKRPLLARFLRKLVGGVGQALRRERTTSFLRLDDFSTAIVHQRHSPTLHEIRFFLADTSSSGQLSGEHWTTSADVQVVVQQMHAAPLDERSLEFYLETIDADLQWTVRYERRPLEGQLGVMRARFVYFTALYSGNARPTE